MYVFVFMLCVILLIPLSMIFIGKRYVNYEIKRGVDISKHIRKSNIKEEKERLYLSGYRTRRSMQNDETFKFAQKLFGFWWHRLGFIIIVPSVAIMCFVFGKNKDIVSLTGFFVVIIQIIFMIIPIIPIERALKKNFDKYGNRIK